MRLKKARQKLNIVMTKAISKSYTRNYIAENAFARSRIAIRIRSLVLVKTNLCDTSNISFSKSY